MSTPLDSQLDTCGCCDPEIPEAEHTNSPGQSELNYRIGTHSEFLRRMIARLPKWKLPDGDHADSRPLGALSTRDGDDPAIATLDAWAIVGDVLSFYQERIANEGFLRTATERRSILELAREIGYELNPGVSASAYLAFTVDDAPGAPGQATIRAGTQVQSVPAGEGELPQTFETGEEFVAYVEWNKILPEIAKPQIFGDLEKMTELYLAGTGLQLDGGDLLLLVPETGDPEVKRVIDVEEDVDNDRTYVEVAGLITRTLPATIGKVKAGEKIAFEKERDTFFEEIGVKKFDDREIVLGATRALSENADSTASDQLPFNADNIDSLILSQELTESELQAILSRHGWDTDDLLTYVNEEYTPPGADVDVYVLRQKVGFFGHNAPLWGSLPPSQRYGEKYKPNGTDVNVSAVYPTNWDSPAATIWTTSQGTDYSDIDEAHVYLERTVSDLVEDTWAVFVGKTSTQATHRVYNISAVSETSLADFSINGKATGLTLTEPDGSALSDDSSKRTGFKVRATTAYVHSEDLDLTELPVDDDVIAGTKKLKLNTMVVGLEKEQSVVITGEQADAEGVTRIEVKTLKEITHQGGRTTLEFKEALTYGYARDTVTINANVVPADHGETVSGEVLGSGDGATTNQRFTLNKAPLTHVSSSSASGAESTLTVRVNGIKWDGETSLYELGPTDKSYIVRINDDAEATVIFGDGKRGARLPTGQENVTATYRSGIGSTGEVDAGALTLLKTRPFGVREVTNPEAATGAADPETLGDARDNAPLTVLTLDRIVSLQDFEDFARAFAGIGKAVAVPIWSGESQLVHITVADSNGDEVKSGTTLHTNLVDAIADARDPLREVRVESFIPRAFECEAKVLIDEAYEWEAVKARLEEALLHAFSFDARTFGQPVSAAEVLNVMHDVDGVIAVDLDMLYLVDAAGMQQGPDYSALLASSPAHYDTATNEIVPAELLLINDAGVTLTQMSAT